MSVLIEIVKDWQTLIAGIMALFAAFLTIRAIRRQISIQEEQFNTIRERKRWAARARMPGALSQISSYCSAATTALLAQDDICPKPPTNVVATLIDSMEYIEKNAADRVMKLVEHIQIQSARLHDHFDPESDEFDDEYHSANMLFDIALLHTYTNSLFNYARRKSEFGPKQMPTIDNIREHLVNMPSPTNADWDDSTLLVVNEIIIERYSGID